MYPPDSYEDAYVRATVDAVSRMPRRRWKDEHLVTPNFRRDGPTWWDQIKQCFLQRLNPYW